MAGLSAAGLADLAGVTEAEVERLVELGILVARDSPGRFLETDVPKVRLAIAWQRAAADGRDRGGHPGRSAVGFVAGGRPRPAMGGALGADLRVAERAPPPGGELRRAGAGAAPGHRPSGTAAGGPPDVTPDAAAS